MDWFDGKPTMTISEAFACAPKMPECPETPTWDNNRYIYSNSDLGEIYELLTFEDRVMHTHTCSGHCFVWNYPNMPYEQGFRIYTYRSHDGWGRVSIQARTMETLIDGSGSRMYSGNWRELVKKWGARQINGENIVLIDFDKMYCWGDDRDMQPHVDAMKEDVLKWYKALPEVVPPEPTQEELSRQIVYR